MIRPFTLTRTSFNTKVGIGDCFTYQNEIYCIIAISTIEKMYGWHKNQALKIKVHAQKENTYIDVDKYEETGPQLLKFNLKENEEIFNIGSIHSYKGINDETIYVKITEINDIFYEFTDLVVEYKTELLQEWHPDTLKKAIRSEKMKKFKVIER